MTDSVDVGTRDLIKEQIKAREAILKPVYLQAATEFADLHDKTGRMKAKNVIRHAVPWERSREYFYYRASYDAALEILAGMAGSDQWDDDLAMIDFYTNEKSTILANIKNIHDENLRTQMKAIQEQLDSAE